MKRKVRVTGPGVKLNNTGVLGYNYYIIDNDYQ